MLPFRQFRIQFVMIFIIQAMQTARGDLKLSQKDVAQKVNEKPSVIQDYESGKAIPNPQILGKLERVLGVKLRGSCHHQSNTESHLTSFFQVLISARNWRLRRRHSYFLAPHL
jgi:transcriptional regulator with XRE-family HTH domain